MYDTDLTMSRSLDTEQEWFRSWTPTLSLQDHVSVYALIRALDLTMHKHIKEAWIPQACERLLKELAQVAAHLRALGTDAANQDRDMFWWEVKMLIAKLIKEVEQKIDDKIIRPLLQQWPSDASPQRLASFHKMCQRELAAPVSGAEFADKQKDAVMDIITDALNDHFTTSDQPLARLAKLCNLVQEKVMGSGFLDFIRGKRNSPPSHTEGGEQSVAFYNWGRYPALRDALTVTLVSHVNKLYAEGVRVEVLCHVAEKLSREPGRDTGTAVFQREMDHDITSIILRRLFVPLLNAEAMMKLANGLADSLDKLLVETLDYREQRDRLNVRIRDLQRSLQQLRQVEQRMMG